MIIHALSDIHRTHTEMTRYLVGGDLLVLAGDYGCYNEQYLNTFLNWVKLQAPKYRLGVILVGGNHDPELEDNFEELKEDFVKLNIYLLNNEYLEIGGLKIFGSPNIEAMGYARNFGAFSKNHPQLTEIYRAIPKKIDLLITHTPARGILDNNAGSIALEKAINNVRPNIHIFGHIHEKAGVFKKEYLNLNQEVIGTTHHFNVSIIGNVDLGPFEPTVIEYDLDTKTVLNYSHKTMDVT